MIGKAALLLVIGFSVLFLMFGHTFNSVSNQSVDNYVDYFNETEAHSLAHSGANLGANAVFMNSNWTTGYSNLHLNGGVINVSVQILNASQNIRQITSVGSYDGTSDTVQVILAPSRFSEYAYYSVSEGGSIWWTGKDTVYGPFHTQDNLRVYKHPVFGDGQKDNLQYTTDIKGNLIYYNNKYQDAPTLLGPFQTGVDKPLPNDGLQPLRDAAANGGFEIQQSSTTTTTMVDEYVPGSWQRVHGRWKYTPGYYQQVPTTTTSLDTVYVTFVKDSVQIKMGYSKPTTTYKTSEIAPDGVIYAQGMDLRLQGTVQGNYSVVSDGNIYLDGDIVYNTNPNTNPNSTDLLGIVAQNNVIMTDNAANHNNINIDAAIYCQNGSFTAQNYDTRPPSGNINLLGGITQNIRGAVGTFSTNWSGQEVIDSGFNKIYRYDKRLKHMFPPAFPTAGGFQIVSWKD